MTLTTYRDRRAATIENGTLRLSVLVEGGHIAELAHLASGVNPLWTPPWPSLEPSRYNAERHPEYGTGAEARLLAGIMGHNLCLDFFGSPSEAEAAAGLTVHGEASILPYRVAERDGALVASVTLPGARMAVERELRLDGDTLRVRESVENLSPIDRPIGWTQHVTLGPPFIENGVTTLECSAARSLVYEVDFAGEHGQLQPGAAFTWPHAPTKGGGMLDLSRYPSAAPASGGYTTHLMQPDAEHAYWIARSPSLGVACGYRWRAADFPWLGLWEENRSRTHAPWNGQALTWGLEFGVSPMPEIRRAMVERGRLFDMPAFRWLSARERVTVEYEAFVRPL